MEENVSYQTLTSKDLARSIMSEGSWSNIMCEGSHQPVDVAIVFVGKELQSSDISGKVISDASLLNLLKEYVASIMEKGIKGRTNLLMVCHRGFDSLKNLDHPHPEGDLFSELISSLDNSGAKFAVLFVSDSDNPIQHPSKLPIGKVPC